MRKILLIIFFIGFVAIIIGNSTSSIFQSSAGLLGNSITVSTSSNTDIKLNEIMPNPEGDDAAPMPDGEWVELYNTKDWSIDVDGWYLYDFYDTHELIISPSNVSGGSTIIPAHGFLVVYRNGDPDFMLNNSEAGDIVRLYDGAIATGTQIDLYSYNEPISGWVFVRIPDGSGSWTASSSPTPGGPNV